MQMRPGRICIAEGASLPANPIRLFWGRCSDISGRSFKDPFWDSFRIVWIRDGLVQIGGEASDFHGLQFNGANFSKGNRVSILSSIRASFY